MDDAVAKSDEMLVEAVQNGDSELFGVLIERYQEKITRYGKRFLYQYEDVEDAVQDVFLKAYTNIQSFNLDNKFSPWIYRIAHNTFIDCIKKRGKENVPTVDPDIFFGNLRAEENPERELIDVEDEQALRQAIEELPPKYREPIILFFYEEKDYKDIGEIMHIPSSTVGVRIRRAKEKIKQSLNHG